MSTIYDHEYMDMNIGMEYRFLNTGTVLTELHDHNYYEYFFITSGTVDHEVNNEIKKLKAGEVVFIRPSDCHRYRTDNSPDFKLINVSFTTKRFNQVKDYFAHPVMDKMLNAAEPPSILLSPAQLAALKKKHYNLNVTSEKSALVPQLQTLLVDVFSYFILEYDRQSQVSSKKWLQSILLQMNTPENIEEGLPALIRYSGFSHGHLCRIMKQELGVTPNEYITNLRLHFAANLLTTTDYDILSVSLRVGFSSLSHFITIFKKKYGVSPAKYRAMNSNIHFWK